MKIAAFCTPFDRPHVSKLQEMIGAHSVKITFADESYFAGIAAKVKAHGFDTIICTNDAVLPLLLSALPDHRTPRNKNGAVKKLALDDYAGSFFTIAGHKFGVDHDVQVLILNPLEHLVTTPEGPFVFRRFISKITTPAKWFPQTRFTWELWTQEKSESLAALFDKAILSSCDIETYRDDELRRINCVGYCLLFADGTTHSIVVPLRDADSYYFVKRCNATQVPKIFQNGIFDNLYFARWNLVCDNWLYDTQNMFHSWYSELPKRLDFITAFTVREIRFWKDDAHAGTEMDLFEYNARDCWATMMAWCAMLVEIPEYAKKNYLMEFPLVFPAHHLELDGLTLDKAIFDVRKSEAEEALAVQSKKLASWIHPNFNPRSPDQCKNLLRALGMKDVEGADAKAMTAAAAVHPFNELVLSAITEYREHAKLLSTYFVWDKFWNGRLHYKTNPAGTDTGRLASTESSFWTGLQIQNIPQGPAVKSWVRCDDGWDGIAEGDYAQSEARCVGYMSGCTALITLVESEYDYHSWNASAFFGVPYEHVTPALRNLAKRVNHGSNYNMGAKVLLDTMGPKAVAQARLLLKLPANWTLIQVCEHLLRVYVRTYPEVKINWYDAIKRQIGMTKKLVSPLGWTRHFFADPMKSKPALNAAVAHGPQNLSVGIINRVFYRVWRASVYGELRDKVRLKAQIHDSLLFCYRGMDTPLRVQEMMKEPIDVKGVDGVTRTMLIPPDMSYQKMAKVDGKKVAIGPAKYWADLK